MSKTAWGIAIAGGFLVIGLLALKSGMSASGGYSRARLQQKDPYDFFAPSVHIPQPTKLTGNWR